MDNMEVLLENVKHLTSIVQRGNERQSDIKRALLFVIADEWFSSKLHSHMKTPDDVMLQVSRVVNSKR